MTNTNDRDLEQRMIGKQLMLVDIIHVETDRERRGWFSRVRMDDVVQWSCMTEDEIWSIRNSCSRLDKANLAEDAARQYAESGLMNHIKGIRFFAFYAYYKLGSSFILELLYDKAEEFCQKEYENIYNKYINFDDGNSVNETVKDPTVLRQVMEGYVRYFITTVEDVFSEGFDWDVVKEMLPIGLSRELFLELSRKAGQGEESPLGKD